MITANWRSRIGLALLLALALYVAVSLGLSLLGLNVAPG
jgi:hypothetical protein